MEHEGLNFQSKQLDIMQFINNNIISFVKLLENKLSTDDVEKIVSKLNSKWKHTITI